MKKLMILLLLVMIGCQPLLSQETASFQIVKIKQIQNNCFELTAKSKGKKYTIYSHYDESAEHVEMIKRQDVLVLKIIPFFKTESISLAEFKNGMGVQASAEDNLFVNLQKNDTALKKVHLTSTLRFVLKCPR